MTRSHLSRARARGRSTCAIAGVLLTLWLGVSAQEPAPDPAGLVIVVNESLDIAFIEDAEIRRLFLGKSRRLPDGSRARARELRTGSVVL